MSVFRDRMYWNSANAWPQRASIVQYGTAAEIPTVRIQILPNLLYYDETDALITSDGAPVAATSPGTWGQLYAAGRQDRRR